MNIEELKKWTRKDWKKNKANKEWLRAAVLSADKALSMGVPETFEAYKLLFSLLLHDVKEYLNSVDAADARKGTTTSPKKAAASAANGKKGGRPKGSKNKPKPSA